MTVCLLFRYLAYAKTFIQKYKREILLLKKKKVSIMIFFEETMLLMIFSPPTYIRRYKNILYIFLNLEKTLALPTSIEKLWG